MTSQKKLIGRGLFTKCWLNDDGKTVTLHSFCPIKECMGLGWFPNSKLFPKVERRGYLDNGAGVYKLKYYPKVKSLKTALKPSEYEFYKLLRKIGDATCTVDRRTRYNETYKLFESIPGKWRVKREALLDALGACTNYGSDVAFEISPRNVAVDKGNLVLLDCFFMMSKAAEMRSGRLRHG